LNWFITTNGWWRNTCCGHRGRCKLCATSRISEYSWILNVTVGPRGDFPADRATERPSERPSDRASERQQERTTNEKPPTNPQVRRVICCRQQQKVRHAQRPRHVHKVLQHILPVLLERRRRVGRHQLAQVPLQVLHEPRVPPTPEHERPRLPLLRRVLGLLHMRPLLFLRVGCVVVVTVREEEKRREKVVSCRDRMECTRVGWGDDHRYVPCACEPSSTPVSTVYRLPSTVYRLPIDAVRTLDNSQCPEAITAGHPFSVSVSFSFLVAATLLSSSKPSVFEACTFHRVPCVVTPPRSRRVACGFVVAVGFGSADSFVVRRRVRSRGGRRVASTHMHMKAYEWPGD